VALATKIFKLYGRAQWAKVQPDQLDLNYDKKSKSWRIDVYLEPKSLELFHQSGLQLKVRKGEDGDYVTFKRPEQKIFKDEIKDMGPPYVTDKEGNPITARVGNGSKVMVELSVYDSRNGKGHTLEGVVVHDLVEYKEGPAVIEAEVPW
jgi:hypothetical protein